MRRAFLVMETAGLRGENMGHVLLTVQEAISSEAQRHAGTGGCAARKGRRDHIIELAVTETPVKLVQT